MSASRTIINDWLDQGGRPETDLELRLVRRVAGLAEAVDERITDPIGRALAGLGPPVETPTTVADRIRLAVACGGGTAVEMGELEDAARNTGDPGLWVAAARLHATANIGREAAARMSLSEQSLPYVFPGEIDPMMVDLFAVGERVLPALHVDWVRKLTSWVAPVLAVDCAGLGMWFWPVLGVLDAGKLARPLSQLAAVGLPPGGLGLAVAYGQRIGVDVEILAADCGELDRRIVALARLGDGFE